LPETKAGFKKEGRFEKLDRAFKADAFVSARWNETDGNQWQVYYMRWNHGSSTSQVAKAHWREICMTSAGKTLQAPPETKSYAVRGVVLPFRNYVLSSGGVPVYVFHCVWEERSTSTLKLGLRIGQNYLSRIQAAWDGKRNLGQQVLELAVSGYADAGAAEAALL
jgi:hypothetical protein